VNLILASTGSYPRIGDSADLQLLRRAIAAADRGAQTPAELAEAENEMTRRAIAEQVDAGVELLTDGQIRWYDPISHLAGKLEGVNINGLLRFFDTNFYFRQPVLTARPQRMRPLLLDEFRFACETLGALAASCKRAGKLAMKAVLTGPYTLAKFSLVENSTMGSLEARALAYAEALAGEVHALAEAGAEFIQIDEPAIVKYPGDWDVFARALQKLIEPRQQAAQAGKQFTLALYVYFHDPAPLYEKLVQLPVDVVGLDFTYNPRLVEVVVQEGSPIPLGLGLVDARNTKLENPSELARQVERMLPKIGGGTCYLGPSSGLEYLPRDRAFAKLALLEKVRDAISA
jgi:5-methyltetrahydropteroyltriglutamate--homocysteine methyltransferase